MPDYNISVDLAILKDYCIDAGSLYLLNIGKQGINTFPIKLILSDNHIAKLDDGFDQLLKKYILVEHRNHLLYLTSLVQKDMESFYFENDDFEQARQSLKQLITLLKIQQENLNKTITISINGTMDKDVVKINGSLFTNKMLPSIISQYYSVISKPIYNAQLYNLLKDVDLNYQELLDIYENNKPSKRNAYTASLSHNSKTILSYLNNQTQFTTQGHVRISNDQARFIHDYFALFNFIDPEQITSDSEDYIRSLVARK